MWRLDQSNCWRQLSDAIKKQLLGALDARAGCLWHKRAGVAKLGSNLHIEVENSGYNVSWSAYQEPTQPNQSWQGKGISMMPSLVMFRATLAPAGMAVLRVSVAEIVTFTLASVFISTGKGCTSISWIVPTLVSAPALWKYFKGFRDRAFSFIFRQDSARSLEILHCRVGRGFLLVALPRGVRRNIMKILFELQLTTETIFQLLNLDAPDREEENGRQQYNQLHFLLLGSREMRW